jgi:hypothetical protein
MTKYINLVKQYIINNAGNNKQINVLDLASGKG